jgi:hypothetical protein
MHSVNRSWHMAARCNDDHGQRPDIWQQANAGLTPGSPGAPNCVAVGFASRFARRHPVNGIPLGR